MTKDIEYIVKAHENYARKESKKYRKWDGETPYYVHPLWCAMTIASETRLDKRTRDEGYLALLYHDILEDTTAYISEECGKHIRQIVEDMTFKSSEEEMKKIWDKPKEIRLYKLYDKVNNLMDGCWMDLEKREKYKEYTRELCEDVEINYGQLNITIIAKGILDN